MSALPGGNIPPSVPGISSPPPVTRSNPDRHRREQEPGHGKDKKENEPGAPKREQDCAELTHHEDVVTPPAKLPPPPADDRPHIDVQG